ncbi:UDP-glucose/GDP-mannose dehydrogenase family protein [candidate division KSB1 bacterium]|nr:UDP-glucose/GDP-mannose dehydrogenase family protein [candidate division KSB1 bacterium]
MHITIVGTGYVGLVTGTCFSEFGVDVICVDSDSKKIDMLNSGGVPIYEPGLEDMIQRNVREGRLSFSTDLKKAVQGALVVFIAVGTPPKEDGSADLKYVEQVAKEIAKSMNGYKVIVNKSTVPVGTGKWVKSVIQKHQKDSHRFSMVSNPEFLREGSAIEDFMRPDRVVIGTEDAEALAIMKDVYAPLYLIETPIVCTNLESAELIKYASNAFLATKISFINEIANMCDLMGADVHHVAKGMGLDGRIGSKFLHPGPGFGGSCFPKDTSALVDIADKAGYDCKIVRSVIEVNTLQRQTAFNKIQEIAGSLKDKKVGMLGLSFKPNTDDMRDAPSLTIIQKLMEAGASVQAFDPVAMDEAKKVIPDITYTTAAYDTAKDADVLIFMTEWNQFRNLNMDRIKTLMKTPIVVDLRNIYDPEKMRKLGFKYVCVGRS